MKSHAKKSLVVAGLMLAAGPLMPHGALAQDMGFYLGASAGQSKAKDACSDLGGVGFTGSCDDKDTGWKLFAGYQFHKHFAVEGAYVDLGKFNAVGTASGLPVSANADAKTWQLVGVGMLPLANNFSVFGKAGIHRWDLDARATASAGGVTATAAASDDGTDFTFGIGAGYEFTKNLGIRVEWERFRDVGEENTTGKSHFDLLSVGLRYRF